MGATLSPFAATESERPDVVRIRAFTDRERAACGCRRTWSKTRLRRRGRFRSRSASRRQENHRALRVPDTRTGEETRPRLRRSRSLPPEPLAPTTSGDERAPPRLVAHRANRGRPCSLRVQPPRPCVSHVPRPPRDFIRVCPYPSGPEGGYVWKGPAGAPLGRLTVNRATQRTIRGVMSSWTRKDPPPR